MKAPPKVALRKAASRWPLALLPWGAGVLVMWLTWPDIDGGEFRESYVGLAVVVLSFVLGPVALALAYLPAVLAGLATVLLSGLSLQYLRD